MHHTYDTTGISPTFSGAPLVLGTTGQRGRDSRTRAQRRRPPDQWRGHRNSAPRDGKDGDHTGRERD